MTTPTPESVKALADLADRVESATGPDRELDAAIAAVVRLEKVPDWARTWAGEWRPTDQGSVVMMHSDGTPGPHFMAREYTASLDAAMTLINGHGVLMHLSDIGADGLPLARVGVPGPNDAPIFTGIASCIMTNTSPVAGLAIALCVAALKARAHSTKESDNG